MFLIFQIIVFVLILSTESLSSSLSLIHYSNQHVLPYRINNIPLETVLFGFNLVRSEIIIFEYIKERSLRRTKKMTKEYEL